MPDRDEQYMEMSYQELAGIFMAKGWKFGDTPQVVLPANIEAMVKKSVDVLRQHGGGYAELGRFVVFRDAEFPGGYEIALKVGYINTTTPDMDGANE